MTFQTFALSLSEGKKDQSKQKECMFMQPSLQWQKRRTICPTETTVNTSVNTLQNDTVMTEAKLDQY